MRRARTHRKPPTRTAQFRAACALAGCTIGEWCETEAITRGHLYQVLRGRPSAPLNAKINAFLAAYLPDHLAA